MSALCHRPWALWALGYPLAALADADHALSGARQIGHAPTLGFALTLTDTTHIFCGNYAAAAAQCYELLQLADEKGAPN
jgi:hypothetical protein